jgi:hypothetical protein
VFARRFAVLGERAWTAYSAAAGVLSAAGFVLLGTRTAGIRLHLHRAAARLRHLGSGNRGSDLGCGTREDLDPAALAPAARSQPRSCRRPEASQLPLVGDRKTGQGIKAGIPAASPEDASAEGCT